MKDALISLGYLILELMGRGVVLNKDILIEHCKKGDLIDYLLSYADNKIHNYHFYPNEIALINNNFYEFMIISKLNILGNRPDQCIYNYETQGLNAVLFTIIYFLSN